MRWDQTEYVLKGLYLGLLVMVALHGPTWGDVGLLAICTFGGLIAALGWSAAKKIQSGVEVKGRLVGFILYLLLDNPQAVFSGVVGGLTLGAYFVVRGKENPDDFLLVFGPVAGGLAVGTALEIIRKLVDAKLRLYCGLGLAAVLIGGAALALWFNPLPVHHQMMAGAVLLLGIPGFYLLTFASLEEETEAEIAALCGAFGAGLWALSSESAPMFRSLFLVPPPLLYYTYVKYVLPGLRVFKHALRGMSFRELGQTDRALESLGRALELDPKHSLAREQLWELHRELDFEKIREQPKILKLVNYPLCLERVAALLLADNPRPAWIQEALHLLELVATQRTDLEPACWYWRAVAACHQRDFDEAEKNLGLLLAGDAPADPALRKKMLFAGWQLALLLHPEMKRRVGEPLISQPARRLEAIAAVERKLAAKPDDAEAWDLKRLVYAPLTEAMYLDQTPEATVRPDFDYRYVQELGLALIDDAVQWRRGCELLRIAARGLPAHAANLFAAIARVHEKFGDLPGMWANFQKAMQVGRAVGLDVIPPADRQTLFATVKQVGERAMAENQVDTALDAFKFFTLNPDAGIETYRTLAELFERKGDAWTALNCVEHALTYNASDADLLARKDRYVYSVMPADLKERWDTVKPWFDIEYCRTKATFLLERGAGDLSAIEWAGHLADLFGAALPGSLEGLVLRARVRRLRGEIPEATELLEKIRQHKPEKFVNEREEDAWYVAHRLLGDTYLEQNPAEAVQCFLEFRKSSRAGADTMYKLGRAYEAVGDFPRAARCFEEVTTFPEHPMYYEARDGLDRVKRGGAVR